MDALALSSVCINLTWCPNPAEWQMTLIRAAPPLSYTGRLFDSGAGLKLDKQLVARESEADAIETVSK